MSFTLRIIIGNAIGIILTVAATVLLNPKGLVWLDDADRYDCTGCDVCHTRIY